MKGAMITAIFETCDDEMRLARALAALVPAATEGVVREVVVVDYGSSDGTLIVADAAGCTIMRATDATAVRDVAEAARGDWLLFLSPATIVAPDWYTGALAFIDRALVTGRARASAATLRNGRLDRGWFAWVRARLTQTDGRLVSKSAYLAATASEPSAASVSGVRRGAI